MVVVDGVDELRLALVEPVVERPGLLLVLGLLRRKETPEGGGLVMVSFKHEFDNSYPVSELEKL